MPLPEVAPLLGGAASEFRSALESAFARISEAHRREVSELRRQLESAGARASHKGVVPPEAATNDACGADGAPAEGELTGAAKLREDPAAAPQVLLPGVVATSESAKRAGSGRAEPDGAARAVGCDDVEKAFNGACGVVPTTLEREAETLVDLEGEDLDGPMSPSCFTNGSGTKDDVLTSRNDAQWQWKHRTGWKDYNSASTNKIEETFQKGHPKARIRSGKEGSDPMEIFFEDMVQYNARIEKAREVRRVGHNPWWARLRRHALTYFYAWDTGQPRTETLETAQARKKRMELAGLSAMSGLGDLSDLHDQEAEEDLYRASGFTATVARSPIFQTTGTLLVALNAIWISIELDSNDGPTPKISFQVVDHVFCTLFTLEIALRFMAYRTPVLCLRDSWFLFDSALVALYGLDTWLLPLATTLGGPALGDVFRGNFTILRVARLLRLTRMIRLLKSMPMMMTLLRGITTSIRPVSIAVCLLLIIVYIFSIVFRSLVEPGGVLEQEFFPSVTHAMLFLLMHGTLLDSVGGKGFVINSEGGIFLTGIFLMYITTTSVLMLNMLIGVVCEMVSIVKNSEDELMAKVSLQVQLTDIMDVYDSDGNGKLKKSEFDLFIRNVEVVQALHHFDVDLKGLMTLCEMLFSHVSLDDSGEEVALGFDEIMNLAVRLKGTSASRVEDIVKLREFTKHRLEILEEHLVGHQRMLCEFFEEAADRKSSLLPADLEEVASPPQNHCD